MADMTPLLMSLPQLMGAQQAIQYVNHQPNMPLSAMPKVPQMGHAAQLPSLPNMPGAGQQQAPQSPFGGTGGADMMQGLMNATGFNPAYYANKAFGAFTPSSTLGLTPMTPNFGSLSLPSLASFQL